jgi:hypothetical protein
LAFAAAFATAAIAVSAHANPITLNFDGLSDGEYVGSYYAGGSGSLGSGPGPNYGITFSSDAFVGSQSGSLSGVVALAPSPPNVLGFDGTGTATMDTGGFTTGLSFYYSSLTVPAIINIWSGLDDTGVLLASLSLPFTNANGDPVCNGAPFCPFSVIGISFNGTAMSVDLASGAAGFIAFDNLTIGSLTPTAATPLPSTWMMLLSGLVGLGFIVYGRSQHGSAAVGAAV